MHHVFYFIKIMVFIYLCVFDIDLCIFLPLVMNLNDLLTKLALIYYLISYFYLYIIPFNQFLLKKNCSISYTLVQLIEPCPENHIGSIPNPLFLE